mgnify:CR=1 FL=1
MRIIRDPSTGEPQELRLEVPTDGWPPVLIVPIRLNRPPGVTSRGFAASLKKAFGPGFDPWKPREQG